MPNQRFWIVYERSATISPMQFITHLSAADRDRLIAESRVILLEAGEHLIRRGTDGGDIYLVVEGRLEVVDSRQKPELIMDVLGEGRVVGEMAFIDQAPRVADVRALEPAKVRHWLRDDLLRILNGDEPLASRFFRALSASTVSRLRATDHLALGLSPAHASGEGVGINAAVAEAARSFAQEPRKRWSAAEDGLKAGTANVGVDAEVTAGLNALVEDLNGWLSGMNSVTRAQEAGGLLRGEVRHMLRRARSGSLGVGGRRDQTARMSFIAHLLRGRPQGTDDFGERLDKAILSLPTPVALRTRLVGAVEAAVSFLPADRGAEIILLEPACGALLARLMPRAVGQGAQIHCLDGDSETLAFADAGHQARPTNIRLNMVHQDVVSLSDADGLELPAADVVILNGLLDYLPARVTTGLLSWCREQLGADGGVVVTGLAPTQDARFMEHVLDWPTMRRTSGELQEFLRATGFEVNVLAASPDNDSGGLVLVGTLPTGGQS